MADARYGNMFDVAVAGPGLTSAANRFGAPTNVVGAAAPRRNLGKFDGAMLMDYKLVLLLGPVNLTAALKASLLDYVVCSSCIPWHVLLSSAPGVSFFCTVDTFSCL